MIKARITYWNNMAGWKVNYDVPLENKNETIRQIHDHITGLLDRPSEIYWDKDLYSGNNDVVFKSETLKEVISTIDYNDFYYIVDLDPEAEEANIAYVGINYEEV